MIAISKFFYSRSDLITSILLTALMVLYASLVLGAQSKCIQAGMQGDAPVLGLRFGYSYETATRLLASMNDEALRCYSELLKIWDNIFPFLYGAMYISWISLVYKKHPFKSRFLKLVNIFPLIPMILDFIENYFEGALVNNFLAAGTIHESQVVMASLATRVKWTFSFINYLIILLGIALIVRKKLSSGKKKKA